MISQSEDPGVLATAYTAVLLDGIHGFPVSSRLESSSEIVLYWLADRIDQRSRQEMVVSDDVFISTESRNLYAARPGNIPLSLHL